MRLGGGACIADKLVQFVRPERVELRAQRRHAVGFQPVELEPSISPADDQASLGKHAKVLRDRRPAHGEMPGQRSDGPFAMPQQLQQPAAVRLRYRSHQVRHVNTLAVTNAFGKPAAVPVRLSSPAEA